MELRPNHDTDTIDIFIPEDEALELITGDGSLIIPLTAEKANRLYAALENAMLIMAKGPGARAGKCVCGHCEDYVPGDPTIDNMSATQLFDLLDTLLGAGSVSRETKMRVNSAYGKDEPETVEKGNID